MKDIAMTFAYKHCVSDLQLNPYTKENAKKIMKFMWKAN